MSETHVKRLQFNFCEVIAAAAAAAAAAKSLQSSLTLCDPIDGSPPGSSVHGIFQARTLEWVAIAFSEVISGHWYFNRPPPPGDSEI